MCSFLASREAGKRVSQRLECASYDLLDQLLLAILLALIHCLPEQRQSSNLKEKVSKVGTGDMW